METKREQHRELLKDRQASTNIEIKLLALEDLRLKSFSQAIKVIKDPSFEQAAQDTWHYGTIN